jgi:uncharacterized delta-60 repeat protein
MKKQITFLIICFLSQLAFAQPGTIDHTFNPGDIGFGNGDGVDTYIDAAKLLPDGKLLIGGSFSTYNGIVMNNIARLNSNGSLDNSFNPGTGFAGDSFISVILDMALLPDGKVLAVGMFNSYNGNPFNSIIRLNNDGSIDASFNPGSGIDWTDPQYYGNYIHTICIQDDGKILIGGKFTSFDGSSVGNIARLLPDGALDESFLTELNDRVMQISLDADGKIMVGGSFTDAGGTDNHRLVRLLPDGTIDSTFTAGFRGQGFFPGFSDPYIRQIHQTDDGKYVVTGRFSYYFSNNVNSIIRLHADGSLDEDFHNPHITAGHLLTIDLLCPLSNGNYMVHGNFNVFDSLPSNGLVQIFENGSIDTSYAWNFHNATIMAILELDNGQMIFCGYFGGYNYLVISRGIARLNADATFDPGFNIGSGANRRVLKVHTQSDGKILVGGWFSFFNGEIKRNIARLNPNGTLDTSFDVGDGLATSAGILDVTSQNDGRVYVSGNFTVFANTPQGRIVRLNSDGSVDETFITGSGANNQVNGINLLDDDKIIINGSFTSFNNHDANRIARLNTDGSLDTAFRINNPNNNISTVSIQQDGKLVIGGSFTWIDSRSRNRIARLNADGSLDLTFSPGQGANNNVSAIRIQDDGKILICGAFSMYDDVPVARLARLHQNGSLDTTFNSGFGPDYFIESMAIQPDGKIILAGSFTMFDSISANRIVRLNENGSVDTTFVTGAGANGIIHDVAIHEHERIIIAGDFTAYDSTGRNRIARIMGDQPDGVRNNFKTASIKVYPNPAQDFIYLEADRYLQGASIRLYDLQGRIVEEQINANGQRFQVSLGKQKPGIYIVEIRHDEFVGRQKVIRY